MMINSINMKVFTGCPCVPGRGTPWGHSCVRLLDTPLSQWGLTTCTYTGLAGSPDPCVCEGAEEERLERPGMVQH